MLVIPRLAQLFVGLAFLYPIGVAGRVPSPPPDVRALQQVVVEPIKQAQGTPPYNVDLHLRPPDGLSFSSQTRWLSPPTPPPPAEFYEEATNLGDRLRKYAVDMLDDISSKYALGDKIACLKSTINTLANESESTAKDIGSHLPIGVHLGHIIDELQGRLEDMAIPEKLQKEFPPPSEAPSHDDRERFSNEVFEIFVNEFDGALEKVGSSEDKRVKIKERLERVRPTVVNIAVTVGDLAEQHPVIAELLPIAATALIVDIFVFRTALRLVGFGPLGPIRGSLAAYAQSYLFGATVPAGSWFSFLQRAGMVPGWLGRFFGGLFGGLAGWFKSIFGF